MLLHTDFGALTIQSFLQELFLQHQKADGLADVDRIFRFAPILLAFAEQIGGKNQPLLDTWRTLLKDCKWVRLQDDINVDEPVSRYASTANAFLPDLSHLDVSKFSIVAQSTADLSCPDATDNNAIRNALKHWGVKDHMSWDDVVDQAGEIEAEENVTASLQLQEYLETSYWSVFTQSIEPTAAREVLKRIKFLPAAKAMDDPKCVLISNSVPPPLLADELWAAEHLLPAIEHPCVWTVLPTFFQPHGKPSNFLSQHCSLKVPEAEDYVMQLEALANNGGAAEFVAHHMLVVLKALVPILAQMFSDDRIEAMGRLQDLAWVPTTNLEGRITQLQNPERVPMVWVADLSPAFGRLPGQWRRLLKRHASLEDCTGIHSYLTASVVLTELKTMADTNAALPLSEDQLVLAANLCRELAQRCEQDTNALTDAGQICFVPTAAGTLKAAGEVFLNDAPWHAPTGQHVHLLHESVDHKTGRTLGCTSVRNELARLCEVEGGMDSGDEEEFGQQEKLSDRIRSLLSGYSDRFDVFTEHWQNSDDAGAESLLFILDLASYPTDSLVDQRDGCCALQGPALLLASSKQLSKIDVDRIQAVGASHKRLQFESAGRFGVGINCLYSVAECPTFLANDAIHVMDPLHCAVTDEPEKGKPVKTGKRYSTTDLRKNFPDMLKPFESETLSKFPTVFRLALGEGYCSGLGRHARQAAGVEKDLNDFAAQAQELLVFSKYVRTVRFIVKKPTGEELIIAEVECEQNSSAAQHFMQNLPSTIDQVRKSQHNPANSISDMKIRTSKPSAAGGMEMRVSHWIVSHCVHADSALIELVKSEYAKDLALLPHGATALQLDAVSYRGRLCCFMPLAGLFAGPPCLLHGCFSLAEDRKSVHVSDVPSKPSGHRWNHALLGGPVARSLANLIEYTRDFVMDGQLPLDQWFSLMELADTSRCDASSNLPTAAVRSVLREQLLLRLFNGHSIFPVAELKQNDEPATVIMETLKWKGQQGLVLRTSDLSVAVQNLLVNTGLPLVHLSPMLGEQFVELGLPALTREILCKHLRGLDESTLTSHLSMAAAVALLGNTVMALSPSEKSRECIVVEARCGEVKVQYEGIDSQHYEWLALDSKRLMPRDSGEARGAAFVLELLRFIVPPSTKKSPPDFEILRGVPLLLLANHGHTKFGNVCIWNYPELLPGKQEQFIHGAVKRILSESCKSLVDVRKAAETLSIRQMTPDFLLQFEDYVREQKHPSDENWSGAFYQLMHKAFSKCKPGKDIATFCKMFANWSLIKVTPAVKPGGTTTQQTDFVPLRDCGAVFSLHQIDSSWQSKLGGVLLRCGLHVWKADQMQDSNRMELMQQLVGQTDDDMLDALVRVGDDLLPLLNPETIVDLLRYFGSRIVPGVRQLSALQLSKIRKLPLFGTLGSSGSGIGSSCGYTDLCDTSIEHVCLSSTTTTKHNYVGELMQLTVPNRQVRFLAWPKRGCDELYKALGVRVISSLDFVVKFVCPALPEAARQGDDVLEPLLMTVGRCIGSEANGTSVVAAAQQQKFVQTQAGIDYVAPAALLDPEHKMVVEFVDTLARWLPRHRLQKHASLLLTLGMQSTVPLDGLEDCAACIDRVAETLGGGCSPDEPTMRQSYSLIEETCRQLADLFRRNAVGTSQQFQRLEEEPSLEREAQLEARLIKVLMAHRIAVVCESELSGNTMLAKFHRLLLTPECTACAGSQLKTLLHEAGRPKAPDQSPALSYSSALYHLVLYYPDSVRTKLTCYCQPMELDVDVLLMQLDHVARRAHRDNALEFRESEPRMLDLKTLLGVLDKTMDPFELSVSEQLLLDELRSQPCLPLCITADAAGDLSATKIRLVRPDRTFLRLEDGAPAESEIPFVEHTSLQATHPQFARALKIAEKPTADDWARCTRIIANQTNGNPATPGEISAVFFALKAFFKLVGKEPADSHFKICFADRENDCCSLLPCSQLVWRDSFSLARRCTHLQDQADLHFVREQFKENGYEKFTPLEFEKLCEVTGVRRLSDVVRVVRDGQTSVPKAPSKHEACLAELLRSVEFVDGYCACLKSSDEGLQDDTKFRGAQIAVRQCLSSLSLKWADQVVTCLRDKDDHDLDESTANEFAFVDSDVEQTLWLQAGVMGTDIVDKNHYSKRPAEESLLEVLSKDVLKRIVRSANAPVLHESLLTMGLLKCWRRGPATIVQMLSSHHIEMSSSDGYGYQPGAAVPLALTHVLQQSADCEFNENDTVAVDNGVGPEGVMQYKYAKVLCSKDLARPSVHLSRQYRLNEGGDVPVVRKHLEIFKFDRSAPASTAGDAVVKAAAGGNDEARELGDEDGSDWQNLVAKLREMEGFVFEDYKMMMRRLFKQWHPDKCSMPHASTFFGVLRRHGETYSGDRDFSWLDDVASAQEALRAETATPSQDDSGGEDFPDWDGLNLDPNDLFAEFEREQMNSDVLRQQGQEQADAATAAWQDSPARAVSASDRKRDEMLSDCYWQDAQNQRTVASVLAAANNDAVWSAAVWHSQQVVELTVKAVMMRTCGITNEELRGKGAHDLTSLMANICSSDRGTWPVSAEDLVHLSSAYLKARYPTSEPTDRRYGESDASRALDTADQVLEWARATDCLPPPLGGGGSDDDDPPAKKPREKPTVMDPAPAPPGPAIPPLAIDVPAPAATIGPAPVLAPPLPPPPPAPLPLWHVAPRVLEQSAADAIEDIAVEETGDEDRAVSGGD